MCGRLRYINENEMVPALTPKESEEELSLKGTGLASWEHNFQHLYELNLKFKYIYIFKDKYIDSVLSCLDGFELRSYSSIRQRFIMTSFFCKGLQPLIHDQHGNELIGRAFKYPKDHSLQNADFLEPAIIIRKILQHLCIAAMQDS